MFYGRRWWAGVNVLRGGDIIQSPGVAVLDTCNYITNTLHVKESSRRMFLLQLLLVMLPCCTSIVTI